jgi:site-specific DNA-methyltransferase (adenine-specific)
MGSGSTAIAALKSDRKYVGYDVDPEYIRIAEERIAPHKYQLSMGI